MRGQFKRMQDTGIDRFCFRRRPRPWGITWLELISRYWTEACNDLIARIARPWPDSLAGVSAAPVARGRPQHWVEELEPLCHRAGVCGLQYQPGCGRRPRALHALARR